MEFVRFQCVVNQDDQAYEHQDMYDRQRHVSEHTGRAGEQLGLRELIVSGHFVTFRYNVISKIRRFLYGEQ